MFIKRTLRVTVSFLIVCYLNMSRIAADVKLRRNASCGIDKSPISVVYEGLTKIEYYPWLGVLFYPVGLKRFTTSVVLVTKQLVIGAAPEIDNMPKHDFRERSLVVLGRNCTGPSLRVREYSFHPEFKQDSYNALALIQLDVDNFKDELRPICPPPTHLIDPEFYAMTMNEDCTNSKIEVHKMNFVDPQECKHYYRRNGLDIASMWPKHTACARARSGGKCLWRSGSILVMRLGNQWRLLGFGVYGPGCGAPARFLDYGMYFSWVKTSIARIGRPAITRMSDNHIILRRTSVNLTASSNLQRFGPCDKGEKFGILYTDDTNITSRRYSSDKAETAHVYKRVRYNVTLYANVEYSCVTFKVEQIPEVTDFPPKLRLRRWCAGPRSICHDFQLLEIDFYVEILFMKEVRFRMVAFGREAKVIDPRKAMVYANNDERQYPEVLSMPEVQYLLEDVQDYQWFEGKKLYG